MSEIGQKWIEAVRKRAADNPDYIYRSPHVHGNCVYVFDSKPSCIIGAAAWDMGLIDASLENIKCNEYHVPLLVRELNMKHILDRSEVDWLQHVQRGQDKMAPWGLAVAWADL